MRQTAFALFCLLTAPVPARAAGLDLSFPFPAVASEALPPVMGRYDMPVAPWDGRVLPVQGVEGVLDRRAWRLEAEGRTLTEVMVPLRDQLVAAGFTIALDCEARACGGFDFRFRTEVLPEPGMHVDLGDFRFVAALRGEAAVSLLVSRSGTSAFVQVIQVGLEDAAPAGAAGAEENTGAEPAAGPPPAVPPAGAAAAEAAVAGDVRGLLGAGLPAALDDLVFASGAAALESGDYASLAAVAAWLKEDPARKVMLVGHTDASGGLEANIALSKRRAEAVRQVLMMVHDVPPAQVSAEGAGPLAPRAPNASEEGRRKNRRVEAIPAST